MLDDSGELVITFNGEIYNFRDLRTELERKGHRFTSSGDTEVALKAYKQWGVDVVDRISGIFALAIWDLSRRMMFLARDPLGVKPLFYSDDGDTFRFGSEVKAILRDPNVDRSFHPEALDAFLTFGYSPAPATGFRTVSQLLPGHSATISKNGFTSSRYWEPPYTARPREIGFDVALDEFRDLLDEVTKSQMVSDVGIGAFLSGGLDSAAIVHSMSRAGHGRVRAFSAGMDWRGFNELQRARSTAVKLDVHLSESTISADDASVVPSISRHLEEPTADSSSIPMYYLSKHARTEFKVVMSGDGADEILAGYDTYAASRLARHYRRIPACLRRNIAVPLAHAIPNSRSNYPLSDLARRFVYAAELGPHLDHSAWRIIFNDVTKQQLYEPDFLREVADYKPLTRYASFVNEVPESRGPLSGLLHADTAFYLPNDMLVKVDRMSMANGLEVRVPFLDAAMVRFCANLPGQYKLKRGRIRKHILRESLREVLPRSVLGAPKSGFNIPVDEWMRGFLRDLLFDAIETSRHDLKRFLNIEAVIKLANRHQSREVHSGHILFVILMFSLWLDNAARCWKPESTIAFNESNIS